MNFHRSFYVRPNTPDIRWLQYQHSLIDLSTDNLLCTCHAYILCRNNNSEIKAVERGKRKKKQEINYQFSFMKVT